MATTNAAEQITTREPMMDRPSGEDAGDAGGEKQQDLAGQGKLLSEGPPSGRSREAPTCGIPRIRYHPYTPYERRIAGSDFPRGVAINGPSSKRDWPGAK